MQKIEIPVERQATADSGSLHRSVVRVGIVGYGTVGRATAEILVKHAREIQQRTGVSVTVTRIARKSPRASETGINGVSVVADWRQVVEAADVDIVVEAM